MRYSNNFQYTPSVKLNTEKRKRFYKTLLYPTIERKDDDIYVMTVIGDRLDLLAWKYYSNAQLWWLLTVANPDLPKDTVFLEPGTQVRIPRQYTDILLAIQTLNSSL